jgi:cell division protein FtsB
MGMQIIEMIFTLAILAIIFGSIFGFPLALARLKHKAKEREVVDESEHAEMTTRLTQLEERIQVLERIVTDERTELRRQFRDL